MGTVFSSGKFVAKYRRDNAKRPKPSTAKREPEPLLFPGKEALVLLIDTKTESQTGKS